MSELEEPAGDDPRPNIAYVDEKDDERDNFFTDAFDSGFLRRYIESNRFRTSRRC